MIFRWTTYWFWKRTNNGTRILIFSFSGIDIVEAKQTDLDKNSVDEKLSEIKIKQDQLNEETMNYTKLLEKDQKLSMQLEDEPNPMKMT